MGSARPRLGVAYYPEQWPRERWELDARLMVEAGLAVARIGEFAWAKLEPRAGEFDFAWFDDAIATLAGAGLDVILGTPTAAPPAWLIERHPEILPLRADGRQPFGNRRHYCPNQPAFHAATESIVTKLAERYGGDDRVIAWQIDNELGGRCYCDVCRDAFHAWLRDRYDSLDALNEAWGTAFWSQVYDNWSQIPLPEGSPVPLPSGFLRNSPNPGLALDFRRFTSDSLIRFLRLQAAILRAHRSPGQRITHNLMGFRYPEIDYHELAPELDVVSWDNYPLLDRSDRWSTHALAGDAMRGLKHAPVWVLEQQVGPLGWELLRTPRRGDTRLYTWQAIAHGAELVCYFRWRTPRFGTEQHWHGILDANGRIERRYEDVRRLAAEVDALGEGLAGTRPEPTVALLHDYDSRFALQVQPTNVALGYEETVQRHYEALRRLGLGVDVVSPAADLSAYRIVVAPLLYVLDEAVAAALTAYANSGGTLVLGPRSGIKDRHNAVPERPVPAWLDALAGLEVVDYVSRSETDTARIGGGNDGLEFSGEVHGWFEELELRDALPLALYEDGPFAGTAAVASRRAAEGRVVYLAGVAGLETLVAVYRAIGTAAGARLLDVPEGVDVVPLVGESERLLFLLNHSDEERVVELGPGEWHDHVAGTRADGRIVVGPLGIALVEDGAAARTATRAAVQGARA
jgi:beta-galactosidase